MGCDATCTGYALANDLDLAGMDWTPIGEGSAEYTSVFEGNGFVISNVSIISTGTERLDNAGLFGTLGSAGRIRNVGLRDVQVDVANAANDSAGAGALVGRNRGRIAASYVTGGMVRGSSSVGGLAGLNAGAMIACYANVESTRDRRIVRGLDGPVAAFRCRERELLYRRNAGLWRYSKRFDRVASGSVVL